MNTDNGQSETSPYGSAYDLPSFVEMRQQAKLYKGLTRILMRSKRSEIVALEKQLFELADQVDAFYARLGSRHWIYNGYMSVTKIGELLEETSTPEEAEERLIELYQDSEISKLRLNQLRNIDGLRQRHHQLVRAQQDYEAGRYDTCTMLLIAVMDGFVNDFQADKRKGLAARDADAMVAWDSATGHHLGLTNALKPFLKTFKKRVDTEVFEVHRHGIVHGSVVHYNNIVVATKAWNLLFAVVDWSIATNKQAEYEAKPPPAALKETFDTITKHARDKKARDEFESWEIEHEDSDFAANEVLVATSLFLDAWQEGQWGKLAPFLPSNLTKGKSTGQAAVFAKDWYGLHEISDVRLDKVTYLQLGVAEVSGVATLNNITANFQLRWVYRDAEDMTGPGDGTGTWQVAIISPNAYLVDENGVRLN